MTSMSASYLVRSLKSYFVFAVVCVICPSDQQDRYDHNGAGEFIHTVNACTQRYKLGDRRFRLSDSADRTPSPNKIAPGFRWPRQSSRMLTCSMCSRPTRTP